MSSTSTPIPLNQFAEAIRALPLSNLHLKAAELQNSIAHLESSIQQLKQPADDGDQICSDAIKENLEVIGRMRERILLLKQEVEQRGFLWGDEENEIKSGVNTHFEDESHEGSEQAERNTRREVSRQGGLMSDEELALLLQGPISQRDVEEEFANTDGGGVNL